MQTKSALKLLVASKNLYHLSRLQKHVVDEIEENQQTKFTWKIAIKKVVAVMVQIIQSLPLSGYYS